ncbi:MAG: hypothetical protein NXI32_02600 [bacterium]|nr:hypothetical protein [bacterium]
MLSACWTLGCFILHATLEDFIRNNELRNRPRFHQPNNRNITADFYQPASVSQR